MPKNRDCTKRNDGSEPRTAECSAATRRCQQPPGPLSAFQRFSMSAFPHAPHFYENSFSQFHAGGQVQVNARTITANKRHYATAQTNTEWPDSPVVRYAEE